MLKSEKIQYTQEQFKNTEKMAQSLSNIPEKNKNIFAILINTFISGIETGQKLSKLEKETENLV